MPVALWPRLYRTVTVRVSQFGPVKDPVLTVTLDNRKEISGHCEVEAALAADMYFTRPYHSWEHGLNEYANGLVRQHFPNGKSLLGIDPGAGPGGRRPAQQPLPQGPRLPHPAEVFAAAVSPVA